MSLLGWIFGYAAGPSSLVPTAVGRTTVVYLRELKRTNCRHWESRVYYDAWNSPYVKNASGYSELSLSPDGTTSDTWLYGTEWRLKSGPAVRFPKKPSHPFEADPA